MWLPCTQMMDSQLDLGKTSTCQQAWARRPFHSASCVLSQLLLFGCRILQNAGPIFLNYCCVPLFITVTFGKILVQVHSWLKQTQNKQWTKQIIGVLLKGNGLLKFYFIGVSWLATVLQSYCGNAGRNRKVPKYWELCVGCNGWGNPAWHLCSMR